MKKKVIVIEDDSHTFDLIKHQISEMGHEIIPVSDIVEFEKIAVHQPDLLLIDDWHPGRVGPRLCQQIKNNLLTAHIPIIVLSTNLYLTGMSRLCKANDYLQKPFDIKELIAKVKFWLTCSNFSVS